jgi:hypothetical protein
MNALDEAVTKHIHSCVLRTARQEKIHTTEILEALNPRQYFDNQVGSLGVMMLIKAGTLLRGVHYSICQVDDGHLIHLNEYSVFYVYTIAGGVKSITYPEIHKDQGQTRIVVLRYPEMDKDADLSQLDLRTFDSIIYFDDVRRFVDFFCMCNVVSVF